MNIDDTQEIGFKDEVVPSEDDAGAAKAAETPASEDSSASTDVNQPEGEDTLSVVRDVVGKSVEKSAEASSASSEVSGEAAGDQPKEQDDENYSDVPFNKNPRFRQLLSERNAFKVDAVRYQNVQSFLDTNGIGAEEAAELLTIGGLIKTNPAEAWKRMLPTVQAVLKAAGEVLPDDLHQRVQSGELNRDAAFEVSRLRAQQQSAGVQRDFEQQTAQRRQQQETVAAIQGAAAAWENDRQTRDPNFEAKRPALMREIAYLQRSEGVPSTPAGVTAQLKSAYETVNASYTPPRPTAPQPRAVAPIRGGHVAGAAQPKIESTMDAIKSVMARRGA